MIENINDSKTKDKKPILFYPACKNKYEDLSAYTCFKCRSLKKTSIGVENALQLKGKQEM